MNFRTILMLLLGLNVTACVTFPTEESAHVKILWENSVAIENCTYKGTVIGSQGHFYDYWLHSDRDMVSGLTHQCLYFEQPHTFEQILFIQTAEPALVGHAQIT